MIRKLLNGDIDRVADIWLKTNLKAHYFISNQYWKNLMLRVALKKTRKKKVKKFAFDHCKTCSERFVI